MLLLLLLYCQVAIFLAAVEAGRWCLAVKKSLPGKKIAKPSFRSLNIAWMVQYFFG